MLKSCLGVVDRSLCKGARNMFWVWPLVFRAVFSWSGGALTRLSQIEDSFKCRDKGHSLCKLRRPGPPKAAAPDLGDIAHVEELKPW